MDVILELFSFQGRANRAWYFWHTFLDGLVVVGLILAILLMGGLLGSVAFLLPAFGVGVAGSVAAVAVTVKRLHDIDRPGWHFLLMFLPLYNVYLALVLLFKRGTVGPNQFGHDPLRQEVQGYIPDQVG